MPIKLNAEKEGREVAQKYKVKGFPTILFLDPKGGVVFEIGGYMPPSDFAGQMESAILVGQLPQIEEQVRKNPKDAQTLAKLVRVYAGKKDLKKTEVNLLQLQALKPSPVIMAAVYNAVGDMYQTTEKWEPALENFKRAVAASNASNNATAKAYALISIATVYNQSGHPKEAAPYLRELLSMGPAKAPYEQTAKSMLKAIGG